MIWKLWSVNYQSCSLQQQQRQKLFLREAYSTPSGLFLHKYFDSLWFHASLQFSYLQILLVRLWSFYKYANVHVHLITLTLLNVLFLKIFRWSWENLWWNYLIFNCGLIFLDIICNRTQWIKIIVFLSILRSEISSRIMFSRVIFSVHLLFLTLPGCGILI